MKHQVIINGLCAPSLEKLKQIEVMNIYGALWSLFDCEFFAFSFRKNWIKMKTATTSYESALLMETMYYVALCLALSLYHIEYFRVQRLFWNDWMYYRQIHQINKWISFLKLILMGTKI